MKIVTSFLISVSSGVFNWLLPSGQVDPQVLGEQALQTQPSYQFTWNNRDYDLYHFEFEATASIRLIDNLKVESSSTQVKKEQDCTYLLNGGFYSKEHRPIGLLISDFSQVSPSQKNQTFNGFIWQFRNFPLQIGSTMPSKSKKEDLNLAVQTGPILMKQAKPTDLRLHTDKKSRRVFMASTAENTIIAGLITDRDNSISGPQLAQMPEIIFKLDKELKWRLSTAINLDGGSAAAIASPDFMIEEIKPAGNFFCIQ